MKRIIMICGLLTAIFLTNAGPVVFTGSTPENGSAITSWDFTLNFDITGALEDCADLGVNVGIGSFGSSSTKVGIYTILYKGNPEDNDIMGYALTKNIYGTSDSFKINGNTISFSFDEAMPIIEGQLYTIVITNRFALYKEGTSSMISSTKLECQNNPIVLKFIGGSTGQLQVALQESIPANNSSCNELSEVVLKFADLVALTNNSKFEILKDGKEYLSVPLNRVEDDGKTIIARFDNLVSFDYKHTYTFRIPENGISHGLDNTVKNSEISFTITGTRIYVYPVVDKSLTLDPIKNPLTVSIKFDIPEGKSVTPPSSYTGAVFNVMYLYKLTEDGETEITYFNGKGQPDGKTIKWTIESNASWRWEPGCKYILRFKPVLDIFDSAGKMLDECSLEPTSFEFTTSSIEEADLPKIELNGIAKLGDYLDTASPDFVDGGTYSYINTIELGKKEYVYNGKKYNPVLDWGNNQSAFLYDVTEGNRVLVKEIPMFLASKETDYEIFSVYKLNVASDFYYGHNYEIVIPSGTLRIASQSFSNYVTNDEIVFNVNGSAVSEFKVISCSVSDNEEMSQLPPAVVWQLEGSYSLASADAKAKGVYSGAALGNSENPIVIRHDGKYTYVYVYETNYDGSVRNMRDGVFFTLTIPEGTIIYPGDESIKNPELKVTIKGIDPKSDEPEFVNTTVTLADEETNEAHSFIVETVKGYPARIQMLPGENWNVADVAHEGKSLSAVNGVYASEPLTGDSKFVATIAYNKDMQFDQTTGVYSVADTNIKVYTENNQIVVSGLTHPTNIAVYSVGGILVKQLTTDAKYDMVRISAETNEIYVVVINGQAAKVRL